MAHPLRLQLVLPRALHVLSDYFTTAAGMCGLLLSRQHPLRAALSGVALGVGLLWLLLAELTARTAIGCFLLSLLLRYAFLFASLSPAGSARMKALHGMEGGFFVHETVTAALLLAQRLSFLALLAATSLEAEGTLMTAASALGALLLPIGIAVSLWATRVVGLDTYYYRDLFMGPRHTSVELRGPYALWPNPMYGVGQLAAYGAALLVLSPLGFVAAALNQVALYILNDLVEQPQLRAARGVLSEVQLRYALSRTGFDRTSELGSRRRSQPPPRIRRSRP
jgi:protein-S-isoprenylcysteine O-methyltransferase Ste14